MFDDKARIQKYKDRVHIALDDFDNAVNNCRLDTPRAVVRLLNELEDATDNNVLSKDEEHTYKEIISNRIGQFERYCKVTKI